MLEDSVTDGYWIILLGIYGAVGFSAYAILFWHVVWRSYRVLNFVKDKKTQNLIACHAAVVSIILIDQLTNVSIHLMSLFIIGALAGRVIEVRKDYFKQKKLGGDTRVMDDGDMQRESLQSL